MTEMRRVATPISYEDWRGMVLRYRPECEIEPIAHDGDAVVAAIAVVKGRTVASWHEVDNYVPRTA